jgi:hypothetical protein
LPVYLLLLLLPFLHISISGETWHSLFRTGFLKIKLHSACVRKNEVYSRSVKNQKSQPQTQTQQKNHIPKVKTSSTHLRIARELIEIDVSPFAASPSFFLLKQSDILLKGSTDLHLHDAQGKLSV